MPRSWMPNNPTAYNAAIQARIRAASVAKKRRLFLETIAGDSEEFKFWLTMPSTLMQGTREEQDSFRRSMQYPPQFILDSINQWGGLTESQLACARRIFAEKQTKVSEWAARDEQRKASAPEWQAGRQTVIGTVRSIKVKVSEVGYRVTAVAYKAVIALEDGRLLYTSVPKSLFTEQQMEENDVEWLKGKAVQMTVTVTVKEEDKSFAFGKLPRDGQVIEVEAAA